MGVIRKGGNVYLFLYLYHSVSLYIDIEIYGVGAALQLTLYVEFKTNSAVH